MADRAPLNLSGWPYNPRARNARKGKGGGGKEVKKRAVWWECGSGSEARKVSAPTGRTQRNGGYKNMATA